MSLAFLFVLVAFILACLAAFGVGVSRFNLLAGAFAFYMLSILVGAWPG